MASIECSSLMGDFQPSTAPVSTTGSQYNHNSYNDNCIHIICEGVCIEEVVVEVAADIIYATTDLYTEKLEREPSAPIFSEKKVKDTNPKRESCKAARNSGQMYWKLNGKEKGCMVEGKKIGAACTCPNKCYEKVGQDVVQKIFRDFWALADYNSQNAYLFGFISVTSIKRRYTRNKFSRRNFTVSYSVKKSGQNVKVCKMAFLNIHGLQKNRGRINNLVLKMKAGESVPSPDGRGRHTNRPNAYSTDDVAHVQCHLELCPKTSKKCGKISKVLEHTTSKCYETYVMDYCAEHGLVPVSFDKFRRVALSLGYRSGPIHHKLNAKSKVSTMHVASQTGDNY